MRPFIDRSIDALILPWHPRDMSYEDSLYGPSPYVLERVHELSGRLPSLVLQGYVTGEEPECHLIIAHTPYRPNGPEWRRNSGWMWDVQIRRWVFTPPTVLGAVPGRKEIVELHEFHTIGEMEIPLLITPTTLGEALLSLGHDGHSVAHLVGYRYAPYFRVTAETFAQRLTTALVNRYVNAREDR